MDAHVDALVGIFEEIKAVATKPFIVCWVAAPDRALRALRERGIAVLRGAEPAVDAASALVRYAAARRHWLADRDARAALRLPQLDLPHGSRPVATVHARELLERWGVNTAACALARSADEAVAAAEKLGYPVAAKIESPDILHKTGAQAVELGLADADAVRKAFTAVTENATRHKPQARIEGVVVQAMAHGDVELALGLRNDPAFGMVVMVVLKDVVFRQAPVTQTEAGRMLDELRGKAILDGARGRPPVDRVALTRLIGTLSCCGAAAGPRLRELDLNPVLAGPDGAVAVDWLMVLDEPRFPRRP
jgi:acetyltransferase